MNFLTSLTIHPPGFIRKIFSTFVWTIPNQGNQIYLTFDDGPIPEVTPWVIQTLKRFNAKATFFCVGENVFKHPEIYNKIIEEGHTTGNHTFNHLKGWKTETKEYTDNIEKAGQFIHSDFFRPPHGQISMKQKRLIELNYKIILWDILSCDFDRKISKENCLKHVLKHLNSGSIIVFHDSIKAWENMSYTLPKVLEYGSQKGFVFTQITSYNE
jgi:peptidoglycan/xylan/chitin deacetylase (PgdA/CDA1 family)